MKNRKWIFGGGAAVLAGALVASWGSIGASDSHPARAAGSALIAGTSLTQDAPLLTLYKNPTCACCADWAEHMRANGYRVKVEEGADLAAVRADLGVPFSLASCHTAEVAGYALEGHVPANAVTRLLQERPGIAGLAVPGMPLGVPGMPGEGLKSYDILSFRTDGATQVYASK